MSSQKTVSKPKENKVNKMPKQVSSETKKVNKIPKQVNSETEKVNKTSKPVEASTKTKKANNSQYQISTSTNEQKNVKNVITTKDMRKETQPKGLTVVKESNKDLTVVTPSSYDFDENKVRRSAISIVWLTIILFIVVIFLGFSIITLFTSTNETIANGVFVKGVDVSGLSKKSAKDSITTFINEHSGDEIILQHGDYQASISLEQISANFNIDAAIDEAYNYTRNGNFLQNSIEAIRLAFSHVDIEPEFTCDEEQLSKNLENISPNLPDTVIDSSYYIEGNTLIATKGRKGNIVNVDEMKKFVKNKINNLNFKDKPLEIITIEKTPKVLDVDKIYNEIHKEAKDAYFTQDPLTFYPSENGMDFAISVDEAKAMLDSSEGEECEIPLKVLTPNVTTNMIGNEAFPNQLSEFSTRYVNNPNRTTNLVLAANKINGTVLMPGETFSYNKVVGERTIAAGYKDAAIYVDGQTVDGLAGGICQVSTTLYEAVLYANLEIVERANHQFVPSYIGAGLDATVVWGLTDFQFKNNRNYPIKILCSVANGVCNFQIRGLATPDDCQVKISATSSSTATSINAVTYKTLIKNGQVISNEIISRDTYKRH